MRLAGIGVTIAVVGAGAGFVVTRAASPAANTTAAAAKPNPSPSTHRPSFAPHSACGGPFAGAGFGKKQHSHGHGGCGGETGTVTRISGSTLTLRTLTGTVTVTTSSSTAYSREGVQVHFNSVRVGEVVAVRGKPSGTSPTATSPIAATGITIEVPSIAGRVESLSGNTITLVTEDGQLESVTLSSSTAYHGLRGVTASRSSLKAGVYIVAEGAQVNLTTLSADAVQVLGTMNDAPHGVPGQSGTVPMPAEPGGAAD
jgi:hypothetical protein